MTKLRMVLAIVNWEHRYAHGKLMGVEWCLERIEALMKFDKKEVTRRYKLMF